MSLRLEHRLIKKIGQSDIIGEQGIALIRKIVLSMNFMFYETGGVEAGIDGMIEMRDETTGQVSNRLLQVQGKATTRAFTAETEQSFEYVCEEPDIEYWRGGTAPVLLIVTGPAEDIAYWKSITDWFKDPETIRSRKVVFDKVKDRFTKDSKAAIVEVANRTARGAIALSVKKSETLTANLLVADFAPKLFWAPTKYKDNKSFGVAQRAFYPLGPSEWIAKGGGLLSFHDLSESVWHPLCDSGATEAFDTSEWSGSDDEDRLRDFVQLLNRALKAIASPAVYWDKKDAHYYFAKPRDRMSLRWTYVSLQKKATKRVVQRYGSRRDPTHTSYFRHSAFWGQFLRYDGEWFLEVTPTYRFTRDGYKKSRFSGDLLKKIKELENNAAVLGQFLMWREYLTRAGKATLYRPAYGFLTLRPFADFPLDVGVPDSLWATQENDPSSPLFDYRQIDE
jgi:hypothetical protein